MLDTPVVFIIFNRSDLAERVFQTIRHAQPKKLLVIADGPRSDRPGEAEKCAAARAVIDQVDWECEVLTNYSDINLGCKRRVSSGIDWVFSQVEEAIILEDDCLPHASFFNYCETLLDYYRHDERIMVVSGNNFQRGQQRTHYSYYFSKYNHCWGWATWRRAWKYWRFDPKEWIEFRDGGLINSVCDDPYEAKYWTDIFDRLFLKKTPDSWDYAWTFACWSQGGLSVLPNVNLVSNIGFGPEATHTLEKGFYADLPVSNLDKITHPPFVIQHWQADQHTFETVFNGKVLKKSDKLINKVKAKIATLKRELADAYQPSNR